MRGRPLLLVALHLWDTTVSTQCWPAQLQQPQVSVTPMPQLVQLPYKALLLAMLLVALTPVQSQPLSLGISVLTHCT